VIIIGEYKKEKLLCVKCYLNAALQGIEIKQEEVKEKK